MSALLGASWKTSITGYLGALALALIPLLQTGRWPSTEQLVTAGLVAVLGRFAKDHNVSGKKGQ